MAKVTYADTVWPTGSPIEGEQLSANGYYTGQHMGMPTQGANEPDVNTDPHYVEHNTIRYGTAMQDAASNADVLAAGVKLTYILTGCSATPIGNVDKSKALTITITADDGYTLPSAVTVKIGGVVKTVTTDYTWSSGTLSIAAAKLTGDVEVTCVATES